MAELDRIRRNVGKMIDQNAPEADIDAYLTSEGVTPAQLRSSRGADSSSVSGASRPLAAGAGQGGSASGSVDSQSARLKALEELQGPVTDPDNLPSGPPMQLDPMAFRMGGGALGATIGGAVAGPPGALLGIPAAELAGQGAELFNALTGRDPITETPTERFVGSTLNMATDAGLSAGLPVVGQGVKKVAGAMVNAARPRAAGQTALQALDDFANAGVSLEGAAGAVSGNRNVQATQEALRRLPGSANIMDVAAAKTRDGIARFAERVASMSGTVKEQFTAGERVQSGVKSFFNRRKAEIGGMYQAVKGLDALPVDIQSVKQQAAEIIQEAERGLGDPQTLKTARNILERPDTVDFATAQALRSDLSRIGRQSGEGVVGKAQAAGKRLSAAMDGAMETSANKLDPEAFANFRKANEAWREFNSRRELLESISQSDTAETAFNRAMAGAKDGPSRLKVLKESIDPKLWDDFVSYKIRDMGLETAGAGADVERGFSPGRFLTNWRGLSKESKDVLFGKVGPLRTELDRLARISSNIKDVASLANTSQTATTLRFQDIATGGVSGSAMALAFTGHPYIAAMTAVGPVAAAHYGAKLMTSPSFVRWLADGMRIAPMNLKGLAAHTGRLIAIAKAQPEIRQEVMQYLDGLQQGERQ